MTAPIVTFWDNFNYQYNAENPLDFGWWYAGEESSIITLIIYNNKEEEEGVSDMENVQITTVTATGQLTGGTPKEGSEVVADKWLNVKSETNGDTEFTSVGGDTMKELGTIASGEGHTLKLKLVIPSTATGGNVNFGIRVSYTYI